ncbi:transposase [Neisseria sp. 74A18]|nr:transposase [Neisseria sp. 74A18]
MATALVKKIYFYRPHRSWEKALNENTNGLIRQYFSYKRIPATSAIRKYARFKMS